MALQPLFISGWKQLSAYDANGHITRVRTMQEQMSYQE